MDVYIGAYHDVWDEQGPRHAEAARHLHLQCVEAAPESPSKQLPVEAVQALGDLAMPKAS